MLIDGQLGYGEQGSGKQAQRLADCEKQLIEAHQWGQRMRDERDALKARVAELEAALQIAAKYLDARAMDNADFHAVMLANRRPEARSDD